MKYKKHTYLFIFLVPLIIFFIVSSFFTLNLPYNDDYPSILDFLNTVVTKKTSSLFFQELFKSYGEHKLIFIKLISWLNLQLTGQVSFRYLTLIGNLSFIIFFYFLVKPVKGTIVLIHLIPISFVVFQFQAWSNYIWAMSALENTLVFCWVILSFYFGFIYDKKRNLIFAFLFALFATYTNGNGIFVFLILGVLLLFKKSFFKGLIFLASFILIFKINNAHLSDSISRKFESLNFYEVIIKGFAFLGSNFYHPKFYWIAVAAGIVFTVHFLYLVYKKYYLTNPFYAALFLFVFITALGVVTQRTNLDIYSIAPSRYRVYGSILIALTYLSFLQTINTKFKNSIINSFLFFSIFLWSYSIYIGIEKMKNRNELINSNSFLIQQGILVDTVINETYSKAVKNKIISPFNVDLNKLESKKNNSSQLLVQKSMNFVFGVDTIFDFNNSYVIKGWAGINDEFNSLNQPYVILYKDNEESFYKSNFIEVFRFINNKDSLKYVNCGYIAVIKKSIPFDSIYSGISRENGESIIPIHKLDLR